VQYLPVLVELYLGPLFGRPWEAKLCGTYLSKLYGRPLFGRPWEVRLCSTYLF
jgi:hypothetical protein